MRNHISNCGIKLKCPNRCNKIRKRTIKSKTRRNIKKSARKKKKLQLPSSSHDAVDAAAGALFALGALSARRHEHPRLAPVAVEHLAVPAGVAARVQIQPGLAAAARLGQQEGVKQVGHRCGGGGAGQGCGGDDGD